MELSNLSPNEHYLNGIEWDDIFVVIKLWSLTAVIKEQWNVIHNTELYVYGECIIVTIAYTSEIAVKGDPILH